MIITKVESSNDIDFLRSSALDAFVKIDLYSKSNEYLNKIIQEQKKIIEQLSGDKQIELFKIEHLQLLNKMLFGRSSEKRKNDGALKYDFELKPIESESVQEVTKKELETVEVIHELTDEEKSCDICTDGEFKIMKGQYEESTVITVIERRFVKEVHKLEKGVCSCGECIKTASGPLKLIEGGKYSIDFGIDVAVSKYADHLPLERQVKIMDREGLIVTSQTLWDQVQAISHYLRPIYSKLHDEVLSSDVVHIDETRWEMLHKDPERWQLWGVCNYNTAYYEAVDTRASSQASKLLDGYTGVVVSDAYEGYKCAGKKADWISAGCWAHARRKFTEVEINYPTECNTILTLIGELFEIERRAKDIADLKRLRESESVVVIDKIKTFLTTTVCLPSSGLSKAINYANKNIKELTVFLTNELVPLTNNAAERVLRGPVVGRKNHYGSKSARGAEAASILYSVIETCKLNKLNVVEYLRHVIPMRLKKQVAPTPAEYIRQQNS